jgi:hypothetical protein
MNYKRPTLLKEPAAEKPPEESYVRWVSNVVRRSGATVCAPPLVYMSRETAARHGPSEDLSQERKNNA